MRPSLLAALPVVLPFFVAIATAGTEPGYQYTYLAGPLPDTLHVEDSPFMVLADVVATQTFIEPGIEILFTGGTKLTLSSSYASRLECGGTEDNPVLFHDAGLGSWGGLFLTPTGNPSYIRLAHAQIWGATVGVSINLGYYLPDCDIYLDTLTISDCTERGLVIVGGSPVHLLSVSGVEVTGSPTGFWFSGSPSTLALQDCRAHSNGDGFVFNSPTTLTGGASYSNEYGFRVGYGSTVNGCSIHDNTAYDVYVETSVTSYPSLNFRYNDWGPTTTAEMEAEGIFADVSTIFDWWDIHSYSLVDYSGFNGGSTGVAGVRVVPTSWGAVKSMFR